MDYIWRPIYDEQLRCWFFILPESGHLASAEQEDILTNPSFRLKLFGLDTTRRRDASYFCRQAPLERSVTPSACGRPVADHHVRKTVKLFLTLLPLKWAVFIVGKSFPVNDSIRPFDNALDVVRRAFGEPDDDACLLQALCRFALFRKLGHNPVINIGAFIPTENMHAWLEFDHQPILESADRLMHFQSLLKFAG